MVTFTRINHHPMKTIISFLLLFWLNTTGIAQITFQKVFGSSGGDYANSLLKTPDGGYLLGANTLSFGDNFLKNYLIRLNDSGDTLWTKIFHGTHWEELNDMANTSDGGFILAGRCQAPAFDYDLRMTKLNSSGDIEWISAIGGSGDEQALSIKQTSDGGYIMAGWTNSFGSGQQDIYLIKTDQNGDVVWSKVYGGNVSDVAYAVCENETGGYTITGTMRSFLPDNDAFVMRTNEFGEILWVKVVGDAGEDVFYDVAANGSGYVVTGYSNSYSNGYDLTILNGNGDGTINWMKAYHGPGDNQGRKILPTNDDGFIITGYYTVPGESADIFALKLTATGDTSWTRTYGGVSDDRALSVVLSNDGYAFGGFENSFGFGNGDVYLVKTDLNGDSYCDEHHRSCEIIDITSEFSDITLDSTTGGLAYSSLFTVTHGGSIETRCSSIVHVNELNDDMSFRVFPNPVNDHDQLYFDSPICGFAVLHISDLVGNDIYSQSTNIISGSNPILLTSSLPAGCYVFMINVGEEIHKALFIVK